MTTNADIKKILDKIDPLIAELDRITGKDNLLVNSENIQRIEARIKTDTAKQIFTELDRMIEELDDSLRTIGEIVLDEEKYQALKKKYKVD
jgi:hypothetical protein